jgi:putative phosphoesterase
MRLGVFADSHDHLDNLKRAVAVFNQARCELIFFAGDFVSSIAIPPLRQLQAPVIACYGDNEGNRTGVAAGMRIVGILGDPPFGIRLADGTRVLLTHMLSSLRGAGGEFDICIYAHTHRADVHYDSAGRLIVNPGETSGWTSHAPSVAIVETDRGAVNPYTATIIRLDQP